jgi:hypothetical protein
MPYVKSFLEIKVIPEDYGKSAFFIKPEGNYAECIQLKVELHYYFPTLRSLYG